MRFKFAVIVSTNGATALYRFSYKRGFGLQLSESLLELDRNAQCSFPVADRHRAFLADVA